MFDVFDILIPELSAGAPLEVRPDSAAFGTRENAIAYFDGLRFAQVLLAKDAYTAPEAWTGSAARANWTVLLAAAVANESSADNELWRRFLAGLVSVLKAHPAWIVICESDCDQNPLEEFNVTPERLSQLLDTRRSTGLYPIALRASELTNASFPSAG